MNSFGQQIKALRETKYMTQPELAGCTGMAN